MSSAAEPSASPARGALAIVTYLRGRDPMAPVFAAQILAGGQGGDTHAEGDYRSWLADAGQADVEVVTGAHPRESLLLVRQQERNQLTKG